MGEFVWKWVDYPFRLVFYRMKEMRCCLTSTQWNQWPAHTGDWFCAQKWHVWPQRPRGKFTLRFESLFLMVWLITSLFTPCIQEESRWDNGVNASGNAHPADKVKAEANRFDLFLMSGDWRRRTQKSKELFPGVTLWGVSQLFPGKGWNWKLQRREASFGSFSQLLVAFFLSLNGVQLTIKLSKINCKWKILIDVKRKCQSCIDAPKAVYINSKNCNGNTYLPLIGHMMLCEPNL